MSTVGPGWRAIIAVMWVVLVLGCGVAVAVLWFYGLLAVFTIGGTPTASATANGRVTLNAAAVVSVVSALVSAVLAVILLWRGVHRVGAAVALALALCAPWIPVWVGLHPVLAGE